MKNSKILGKVMVVTVIALGFVSLFAFGIAQQSRAEAAKGQVENTYRRAFYELVENVEDMRAALLKCALTADSYQLVNLSGEISQHAAFATANLGQIPFSEGPVENISKFLSQSGDYAHYLALKHIDNSPVAPEETKALDDLCRYADKLHEALSEMATQFSDGAVSFSVTEQELQKLPTLSSGFSELEHSGFSDYPSLIYDGMFSEHVNTLWAVMLDGLPEVTEKEAYEVACTAIENKAELELSDITTGQIPAYYFSGDDGGVHYSVEVSVRGGKCVNMMVSRAISDPALMPEQALSVAAAYLEKMGLSGMQENYYEITGGSITINYAYVQDGVVMYPDLVKVKVALDNGEVIGYEAHGYLMNHQAVRYIPTPTITPDEASAHLRSNFAVARLRRAVIPTDFGQEVDCYEIKGEYNGHTFLVYVNTKTGREENILLVINSQNGTLTI